MIEAIIDYIQSKGYQVRVEEKRLVIYKEVAGVLCQSSWMISEEALKYSRSNDISLLRLDADYRMHSLDEAIAKGPPKT